MTIKIVIGKCFKFDMLKSFERREPQLEKILPSSRLVGKPVEFR